MKLERLSVDGFGKLVDRTFSFQPGLNVVLGPNEAGKSTLAAAIVAVLYGTGRSPERERFRPWDANAPFAATLRYALSDGRSFEVHRDFSNDPKGVSVVDQNGRDAAAEAVLGKYVAPGETHLRMSLDVFVNAACVRQQAIAIETKSSSDLSAALSRALDGGPREDAAERALASLDLLRKREIGAQKATKNAPLRHARKAADDAAAEAEAARRKLHALADRRAHIEHVEKQQIEYESALRDIDRRKRTADAITLRRRIEGLRDVRAELAAAMQDRAAYDDVATFPAERMPEIEHAYRRWYEARVDAESAAREAERAQLAPQLAEELEARSADAGRIDDTTFAALSAAADGATAAMRTDHAPAKIGEK